MLGGEVLQLSRWWSGIWRQTGVCTKAKSLDHRLKHWLSSRCLRAFWVVMSQFTPRDKLQRCCVPRRGKLPWTILQCKSKRIPVQTVNGVSWKSTPFSSVKKKSTRVRYSERFRVYIAAAASQKTTTRWLNVKCAMNGTTICESIPKIAFTRKQLSGFVFIFS